MKNLFLIDGTSGTGKSDLLQYVTEFSTDVDFVRKYTTRRQRDYEKSEKWLLDLRFVSEKAFGERNLEYEYVYSGFRYGLSRKELELRLATKTNVFVIVRNIEAIQRLVSDYRFINVVPVFVYTDRSKLEDRLRSQGVDQQ